MSYLLLVEIISENITVICTGSVMHMYRNLRQNISHSIKISLIMEFYIRPTKALHSTSLTISRN